MKEQTELLAHLIRLEESVFADSDSYTPWNSRQLEEELHRKDSLIFFVEEKGEITEAETLLQEKHADGFHPVGYVIARIIMEENTVDLLRIGVAPPHRRKNLARTLLEYLERETGRYLGRPLFLMLEVSERNMPAIRLYGTTGYRIIHRRKNYYRDSSSAIIMRKDILE